MRAKIIFQTISKLSDIPVLDRPHYAAGKRKKKNECLANNTARSFAGFIGAGLNFITQQRLMWYILFVVYAPYAMLPLPLRWCVLAGYGTALTHMVLAGISLLQDSTYVRRHIVDSTPGTSVQNLQLKRLI